MSIYFIVSIICLSLCVLMFFYFKWYIKKRTSDSALEEYRREVNKLISDINAVTDRNLQLVEDSIAKLKTLLDETEKRIAVYNSEREKSRSGETLYTSLGRGIRAALKTIEEPANISLPNAPQTQASPAPLQQTKNAPQEPPAVKPLTREEIRDAIDSLINEGLSQEEIASRLGITIAEVNLAMNLFRRM